MTAQTVPMPKFLCYSVSLLCYYCVSYVQSPHAPSSTTLVYTIWYHSPSEDQSIAEVQPQQHALTLTLYIYAHN